MNPTFTKALLFALSYAFAISAHAGTIEVGVVQSVSEEHLILKQTAGTAHIGFLAVPAALRSLKSIRVGQEVRAEFGTMTDSHSGAKIGKLLSIRACASEDAQCASDRKRAEEKPKPQPQVADAGEAKQKQCLQTMQKTLESDSRYGPPLDPEAAKAALDRYSSFSDEERSCASQLASALREAYLNACELHHCGDGIAGGCAHLAGSAMRPEFHDKAVAKCKP
jgi:hypothetical protein